MGGLHPNNQATSWPNSHARVWQQTYFKSVHLENTLEFRLDLVPPRGIMLMGGIKVYSLALARTLQKVICPYKETDKLGG